MKTSSLKLVEIKGGWAAVGSDWAVFGKTREDASDKFREAEVLHTEILKRPLAVEEHHDGAD
jgi:hypothetical protein